MAQDKPHHQAIPAIQTQMRDDWNRRISHDFLAWMNDRVLSEEELWDTGKRDYQALTESLHKDGNVALEIGCGVGRLLRFAAEDFETVIGTDISEEATNRAKQLLSDFSNVQLQTTDGTSLDKISDRSVDLVYSFGVLSNVPVIVCAHYFLEISRILASDGEARLLLFIGECQPTVQEDTVAFRSFSEQRLRAALEGAGLTLYEINKLPIEQDAPSGDGWLEPTVCSIRVSGEPEASAYQLEQILWPGGEGSAPKDWPGSSTEFLLSTLRAEELLREGRRMEAKRTLLHACQTFRSPDPKILNLLNRL